MVILIIIFNVLQLVLNSDVCIFRYYESGNHFSTMILQASNSLTNVLRNRLVLGRNKLIIITINNKF